jgi:hypothetical protein
MRFSGSSSSITARAALLALALSGFAVISAAQDQTGKEGQPKAETKTVAMTGCVDEQGGHYILVEDRNMTPIADLVADGFPTEAFAKHMGHKVTVRGTSSSNGNRPTFKVRNIEAVSDSCGPQ